MLTVTRAVASSDDIAALYLEYIELVDGKQETRLEIDIAPGTYGVATIGPIRLDLGGNPAPKQPAIDVVLRGPAGEQPAVLCDLGMLVIARSLRLENLILTGRHQSVLDARVARALTIERCVVASNEWGGPWGGALLRVAGVYGQPAYRVDIRDSWFVRNGAQSEAALLEVAAATGSFVEHVELRRVTFLDNATHSDLLVREARAIYADDVLAVKSRAGGAAVLRYAHTSHVAIERSTFVVDDPAAIACDAPHPGGATAELGDSTIYVPAGAARKLPPNVRGRADVLDRAPVRAGALADVAAAIASRIPDPELMRARLRGALGL